jgi:hypothetical protein
LLPTFALLFKAAVIIMLWENEVISFPQISRGKELPLKLCLKYPDITWRLEQETSALPTEVYSSPYSQPYGRKVLCKTPWPLVRKRTIPTERPPLVDEILVPTFVDRGASRGQRDGSLTVVNLSFLDLSLFMYV